MQYAYIMELLDHFVKNIKRDIGSLLYTLKWKYILVKFSSLVALEVVKMTTPSAASDDNFVKMTFSVVKWD